MAGTLTGGTAAEEDAVMRCANASEGCGVEGEEIEGDDEGAEDTIEFDKTGG